MQVNRNLNLQNPRNEGLPQSNPPVSEITWERINDLLDHTRSIAMRAQKHSEINEQQYESLVRRVRVMSVMLILAIVGIGGLAWLEFSIEPGKRAQLLDGVRRQVGVLEQTLTGKAGDNETPVGNLGGAAPAGNRVSEPIAVPAGSDSNKPHVDSQTTGVSESAHGIEGSPSQPPERTVRTPVSDLNRAPAETPPDTIADNVDRRRIDFEVTNNLTKQVAPGIYLTVKDTDVEQQNVDGWLQISSDGGFVWIRNQKAQASLSFVSRTDRRSSSLVFTKVGKYRVAGYVMVPTSPPVRSGN